jgi:predicted alpha/beta-fold hydrolase
MRFHGPQFRARSPWWGPDLQTLRNVLRGPSAEIRAAREQSLILPLADGSGDALCGELAFPIAERSAEEGAPKPLVVLVHGLSGSAESAYMVTSAGHWLALGHRVLRLSLRGAGASRAHCRFQYHPGRTQDLRDALHALDPALRADGLVLVGYSLGGNMVLKFLAEHGAEFPIHAAASVSAPIDLSAASQRFLHSRNKLYHRHLLATMKLECFGGKAEISESERPVSSGASSPARVGMKPYGPSSVPS